MSKRVLICSVGGSPVPVVNAVTQNRADWVVFLCSTGEDAAASDRTVSGDTTRKVKVTCPACKKTTSIEEHQQSIATRASIAPDAYAIESVANPDDFAEVVAACERIAKSISARFVGEDVEVTANYTGGTKTMTAALVAFALRQPGWICQVNAGPRGDLIGVRAGDVALPQDVSTLMISDVTALAHRLIDREDYAGAVDVLTQTLTRARMLPADRAPLMALRARAELMVAWDAFDHAEALNRTATPGTTSEGDQKRLKVILRARELLGGPRAWGPNDVSGIELVEDLVENALRCERRGRYDDAVGRLYRTTELLAQIQLRRGYDIRTGDVAAARVPEAARGGLNEHMGKDGKIKLGLVASFELLSALGDPLGLWFAQDANKEPLKEFLRARNDSLYAHGLAPVDAETWRRIGARWIAWIRSAIEQTRSRA